MLKHVIRGNTTTEIIDFTLEECCNCSLPFFMPSYMVKRLKASLGSTFYCPNGHAQHYTGKSEAQKLREQLADEKHDHDVKQRVLLDRTLSEISLRKKAEQKLRRVNKGLCPCCNRSFTNLQRHMETKHKDVTS